MGSEFGAIVNVGADGGNADGWVWVGDFFWPRRCWGPANHFYGTMTEQKRPGKVREFREFRVFWKSRKSLNSPKLPNDPAEAANMMLTLCNLEGYMLRKHVDSLEKKHQTEGGLTERLYRKRKEYRGY